VTLYADVEVLVAAGGEVRLAPRMARAESGRLTLRRSAIGTGSVRGRFGQEVTIKLSDQGGGIARSDMKRIWSYSHTTATPLSAEQRYIARQLPMAGFGYGLPMSRLVRPLQTDE